MNSMEMEDSIHTLLDEDASDLDRAVAARRLAEGEGNLALDALIQLATEADVAELVGFAVGESIAEILVRRGAIDTVPLHDFSAGAYVGYDQAIARHLRGLGQSAA